MCTDKWISSPIANVGALADLKPELCASQQRWITHVALQDQEGLIQLRKILQKFRRRRGSFRTRLQQFNVEYAELRRKLSKHCRDGGTVSVGNEEKKIEPTWD
ncbi:hypothetical protein ACFX15_003775 [Malus domestica]